MGIKLVVAGDGGGRWLDSVYQFIQAGPRKYYPENQGCCL